VTSPDTASTASEGARRERGGTYEGRWKGWDRGKEMAIRSIPTM